MNNHAKRLVRELETLGFRRDYDDPSKNGRVYRHPNDPSQVIKVFDAMSDNSITAATRKANKIAETGWSGPRMPSSIKERARVRRSGERAEREREARAREERAERAEREHEARLAVERAAQREAEIASLMQPGHGR